MKSYFWVDSFVWCTRCFGMSEISLSLIICINKMTANLRWLNHGVNIN